MPESRQTDSQTADNEEGLSGDPLFSAVRRVYGEDGLNRLRRAHVCVAGIGGVGSWIVEAFARSGVGSITMIDHDDVAVSNINRQVHADAQTVGLSKVEVMAKRVTAINTECRCYPIDDMLVTRNLEKYIDTKFDFVVDAIDTITFKASLIHHCKRRKIPIITIGGAGGRTDPAKIGIVDLNKTWNDTLASSVRKRLRQKFGWSRNPARRYGVECVFSNQQPMYPQGDGTIAQKKPGVAGLTLDCDSGYGSLVGVTAVFGFVAASRVMNKLVDRTAVNTVHASDDD